MAKFVTPPLSFKFLAPLCLGALVLVLACHSPRVHAADPTRPPPEFTNSTKSMGNDALPSFNAQGLVLQSVLISSKRQRALISGQTIPLGGRIGDAKLVKITETYVVLQGSQGSQTLELTPGIHKRQPEALVKPQNKKKQRHTGGKP